MSQCQNPAVPSLLADVVLHLQDQIQQVPSSAPAPGRVHLSPWEGTGLCTALSALVKAVGITGQPWLWGRHMCCNFCRFQLNAGAGSRAGASLGKALSECRGCCGVGVSWGGGLLGWAPPIPVSHGGHYQCQGAACYSWLAPGDAQSNGRGQQERAEREKGWWPQLARCCLRRLCDTRPAAGWCFTKGSSCPGTRLPAVPPCSPSAAEGQGRAPRRPTDLS